MHGTDVAFGKDGCSQIEVKKEDKHECCAHQFKHCGMLMKFQWKVSLTHKTKARRGGGSYHAACAARHLERHCNESGRDSIQE